jgi:hypothetical protein
LGDAHKHLAAGPTLRITHDAHRLGYTVRFDPIQAA